MKRWQPDRYSQNSSGELDFGAVYIDFGRIFLLEVGRLIDTNIAILKSPESDTETMPLCGNLEKLKNIDYRSCEFF